MYRKKICIITAALILGVISFASLTYAKNDNSKKCEESSTLKNVIPDASITASVKAQYYADEKVKASAIRVETINGKVTLYGVVPSEEIKERAISIARNVNGVKEVVAKIEVVK